MTPKVPKGTQRLPKASQRTPKGSQRAPKVSQRAPKGSQKVTKVHPKVALGAKVDYWSHIGASLGAILVQNPVKILKKTINESSKNRHRKSRDVERKTLLKTTPRSIKNINLRTSDYVKMMLFPL
jgi:hypothetical protein